MNVITTNKKKFFEKLDTLQERETFIKAFEEKDFEKAYRALEGVGMISEILDYDDGKCNRGVLHQLKKLIKNG